MRAKGLAPRAIILAAGSGRRLHGAGGDCPKCLLRVGSATLLHRQLAALRACGISDITVVAGYQEPRVAEACGTTARVVENGRYAETNSLFSLWLTRDLLTDGFLVLNGDVLFHPQLLRDLVCSRVEDALLVAFRDSLLEPFGVEEMKVQVRGGRVADIAKTLPAEHADGENVGIAKFGPAGARQLVAEMDAIVSRGGVREWAPRAFQAFARVRPLHAIGTRGFPWIEIDFPEDYARASQEVLPSIEATFDSAAATPAVPTLAPEPMEAEWRPQPGHV
ncbi:MAG TPA: phosphocholine cytidylyltransferase family protein [Vicinamibacterales bacterium]|nr:phosphocholine cytidylyltransferase family protein [Vicinamibacterales bacterium]